MGMAPRARRNRSDPSSTSTLHFHAGQPSNPLQTDAKLSQNSRTALTRVTQASALHLQLSSPLPATPQTFRPAYLPPLHHRPGVFEKSGELSSEDPSYRSVQDGYHAPVEHRPSITLGQIMSQPRRGFGERQDEVFARPDGRARPSIP
jgi:hypothetical protein